MQPDAESRSAANRQDFCICGNPLTPEHECPTDENASGGSMAVGPSDDFLALLRGEINSKEYVTRVLAARRRSPGARRRIRWHVRTPRNPIGKGGR